MKYYKFEKIVKGENPIVRVTYKTWYGSLAVKDICKYGNSNTLWAYVENDALCYKSNSIDNFYNGEDNIYWVNGQEEIGSKNNCPNNVFLLTMFILFLCGLTAIQTLN